MDKIKVNNQVVSMRKLVKQAKVHVVSKLVKDVNALRTKKGTEQQLAKNKRKEERLIEEIKIIQKLPPDEVSRSALMRLKDWDSLIPDKTISLKDRSFARVAGFNPLQKEVKRFIDDNPKLVNLLPDFFEEWNTKKSNPLYQEAKKIKASELKFKRKQKLAKLKEKLMNRSELRQRFNSNPKEKGKKIKAKKRDSETILSSQGEDNRLPQIDDFAENKNNTLNKIAESEDESEQNEDSDFEETKDILLNRSIESKNESEENEDSDFEETEDILLNRSIKSENESEENADSDSMEIKDISINKNIKSENEKAENDDLDITKKRDDFSNENSDSESSYEESKEDLKNNANFIEKPSQTKFKGKKEMAIFSLNNLQSDEIFENDESNSDEENDREGLEQKNVKKDAFFLTGDESSDEESEENISKRFESKNFQNSFPNKTEQKHFKKDFSNSEFSMNRSFQSDSRNNRSFHRQKPYQSDSRNNRNFQRQKPYQRQQFDRNQQKNEFGRTNSKFSPHVRNQPMKSKDKNWNSRSSFQKPNKGIRNPTSFNQSPNVHEKESKLHPSWEAKRKLKQTSQLLPFKGKKITFEE